MWVDNPDTFSGTSVPIYEASLYKCIIQIFAFQKIVLYYNKFQISDFLSSISAEYLGITISTNQIPDFSWFCDTFVWLKYTGMY